MTTEFTKDEIQVIKNLLKVATIRYAEASKFIALDNKLTDYLNEIEKAQPSQNV